MRDVETIVATATELSYQNVTKSLAAISDRLAGIPHQLLLERSKQDDLQLQLENMERDLIQLDLAASIGIDNAGKLRAEQNLQDQIKKTKAKLTGVKLEQDRVRSEKCHLETLQKDLQAKQTQLEQKASAKKSKILQDHERQYVDDGVYEKALDAVADYLVYTSLKLRMSPQSIRLDMLMNQEINKDNALVQRASSIFDAVMLNAEQEAFHG